MLTTRTQASHKAQGQGTGADEHMTKPFEPEEAMANAKKDVRQ